MLQKRCVLACVTIDQTLLPEIPKNRGLPMASRGTKTHQIEAIAPFPAQSFAQRPCLRFHARPVMRAWTAKRHRSASALGSAHGSPNSVATPGRRKQHYEATRLAFENRLQFSQKQPVTDCYLKRFQVFSKANLET